jgi:hypothetical protein
MGYRVGTMLSIYSSSRKVDSANFAMAGSPKFARPIRFRDFFTTLV